MSTFSRQHLVQVGILGQIGRFTSVDAVSYRRGMQVICRTSRGIEIGQVLSPVTQTNNGQPRDGQPNNGQPRNGESDGSILRGVTVEDQLLVSRLDKNKREAFAACQTELANRQLEATLIETEQLFDGQSIYFYFLGQVSPEVELLIAPEIVGHWARRGDPDALVAWLRSLPEGGDGDAARMAALGALGNSADPGRRELGKRMIDQLWRASVDPPTGFQSLMSG
ncbi:MAG: PSP1 domain-containing protein, partial [Planctomycetales bacterium]